MGTERSRRGLSVIGAIALVAVFMILLACMSFALIEFNHYSQSSKLANEVVVAKSRESLRVVQVSKTLINVTNEGSTPSLVVGIFRVNPADKSCDRQTETPVAVPLMSTVSVPIPNTPENWLIGVVTSNGNVFWEEEPTGGTVEPVPPGETAYVTFAAEGLGSDASGTVLTVDGTSYAYSQLPKTFAWVSGSTHSFSWASPVSGSSGVRYAWTSTRGLSTKQQDNSFTVSANGYIIATYKTQCSLTINANPSAGGSTNPSPGTYWYDPGSTVQISATAASGYAFDRWSGSGSGSYTGTANPATVTMNGPITETAYFFTFSISVSPSSGSVAQGGSVSATVTVTYQGGYSSKSISFSASGLPSGASASFSPSSVTISPSSTTATSTMTITTSSSTPAGTYTVTITGTGGGVSKTTSYTLTVSSTATVKFSASGLGTDISSSTVVLVVDGVNYYRSDLPKSFTWSIGSTHSFEWKDPVASTTSGKRYVWASTSGLSTARSGSINVPSGGGSVSATYKTQYYLTMQANPSSGGTVSPGSGWRDAGTQVQISATPASGYAFSSWTGSGSGSYTGTANPATITMNGPITETANFALQFTVQLREFDRYLYWNPDIAFSTPSSGILRISSTTSSMGRGYVFFVLPRSMLDGKRLQIRWNVYYTFADSRDLKLATLYVFDAVFDRKDMTSYFKPNTNSEPIFSYTNVLATHYPGPLGASPGWLGWRVDTSSPLSLSSWTSDYVTVMIRLNDAWAGQAVMVDVDYINVLDSSGNIIWSFSFDGAVTMEVTGTINDYGVFG